MNATVLELSPVRPPEVLLDRIGFELGWDYAHHRLQPPAPFAEDASALRDGLLAARATFGLRTLAAPRHVHLWLQLRLHAWLRGRSVEGFQVTPHYLRQLEASHCPITRMALDLSRPGGNASIDRVRNDAGYAAGNLAMMSTKANHAKSAHDFRSATRLAGEAGPGAGSPSASASGLAGLTGPQWRRVATLCSFVEPLDHAVASSQPMHVLPPNRLRLFNPVQALQALLSRQLLQPGWSHRCARFESLLQGPALRRDFKTFMIALLPRVLEAGRTATPETLRWAVEDAWADERVQKRWQAFAGPLTPAACESLVRQAAARKLATCRVETLGPALAIEGWSLETRGWIAIPPREPRLAAAG